MHSAQWQSLPCNLFRACIHEAGTPLKKKKKKKSKIPVLCFHVYFVGTSHADTTEGGVNSAFVLMHTFAKQAKE